MTSKINFAEFTLDAPLSSSDSSFTITSRSTRYDLHKDRAGTILTSGRITIVDREDPSKREILAFSDATTNGTTDDGRQKYTITIALASDGSTKLRGLANDEDGTNDTANVIAGNVISQFSSGSTVRIAWDVAEQNRLENFFAAVADSGEAIAGENITALEAVSLHTDGKLYKYNSTNYPELVGIAKESVSAGAACGFVAQGGLSTGHAGLTAGAVYAENTGAVTQTPSATTKILGLAQVDGSGIFNRVRVGIQSTELVKAEVADAYIGTDDTKYMTPVKTRDAIDNRVGDLANFSDTNFVVRSATAPEKAIQLNVGNANANVDVSQTTGTDTFVSGDWNGTDYVNAQTWQPAQSTLTGVALKKATADTTATGALIVEVVTTSSDIPTTTVIGRGRYEAADFNAVANNTFFIVPMSMDTALATDGTKYALRIRSEKPNEVSFAGYVLCRATGGSVYADGSFWESTDGGASYTEVSDADIVFETYYGEVWDLSTKLSLIQTPTKVVLARTTGLTCTTSFQTVPLTESQDTDGELASHTYTAQGDGFRRFIFTVDHHVEESTASSTNWIDIQIVKNRGLLPKHRY